MTTDPKDLVLLDLRIRNRQELESWLANPLLQFNDQLLDTSLATETEQFLDFFRSSESAADAVVRANVAPWFAVLAGLAGSTTDYAVFQNRSTELISWILIWDRVAKAMSPYLLPEQVSLLMSDPEQYSQDLLVSLQRDFDSLADMDRLFTEMSPSEQSLTQVVLEEGKKQGQTSAAELSALLENSIKLSWISHIETKNPALRSVTSLKMKQWE